MAILSPKAFFLLSRLTFLVEQDGLESESFSLKNLEPCGGREHHFSGLLVGLLSGSPVLTLAPSQEPEVKASPLWSEKPLRSMSAFAFPLTTQARPLPPRRPYLGFDLLVFPYGPPSSRFDGSDLERSFDFIAIVAQTTYHFAIEDYWFRRIHSRGAELKVQDLLICLRII